MYFEIKDDSRNFLLSDNKIKFCSDLKIEFNETLIGKIDTDSAGYFLYKPITGEILITKVLCNNYHWKNIEQAEWVIAAHIFSKHAYITAVNIEKESDIEFERFVKNELGDIPVKENGRYISMKISNYRKIWDYARGLTNK